MYVCVVMWFSCTYVDTIWSYDCFCPASLNHATTLNQHLRTLLWMDMIFNQSSVRPMPMWKFFVWKKLKVWRFTVRHQSCYQLKWTTLLLLNQLCLSNVWKPYWKWTHQSVGFVVELRCQLGGTHMLCSGLLFSAIANCLQQKKTRVLCFWNVGCFACDFQKLCGSG